MNSFPMKQDLSDNGVNFDLNHYGRVYAARKAKNEDLGHKEDVKEIPGLTIKENTPIYDTIDRKYVYVQSMHKHWYRGWYHCIVYYTFYNHRGKVQKSHGTMWIANINCHNPIVLEAIEENEERYDLRILKKY